MFIWRQSVESSHNEISLESDFDTNENSKSQLLEFKEISLGCFSFKGQQNTRTVNEQIISQLIYALEDRKIHLGRICFHESYSDLIQTMIIALHEDYEVKKHIHYGPEVLQILRGELLITEHLSNGNRIEHNLSNDKLLICRMPEGAVHSVRSLNGWAIFLEVGNGPFNENKTIYV